MRTYPTEDYQIKEAARLGAPQWMLDTLKFNPSYVFWGNHEDYMMGKDSGWREPQEVPSVKDLWPQDELNEVVHGYYFIARDATRCQDCDGSGYNPATKKIADDWYGFRDPWDRWDTKLTQDEVDALIREGRLRDLTKSRAFFQDGQWVHYHSELKEIVPYTGTIPTLTAEEVNTWASGRGLGHDAINRGICVKIRATRLGVYGKCPTCGGHGSVFTEDKCRLALQLWMIHPRKGAARGVIVRNVEVDDLTTVQEYFKTALKRTVERFSKLAGE